jgi:cytochrome c-type biogenesis protein CcmE
MTRKQRRGVFIGTAVGVLALATMLVMFALSRHVDVFRTPTALKKEPVAVGTNFRLGGLVAKGSVQRGQGTDVAFDVTDTVETLKVRYSGILPDLFREGQGIVAMGKLDSSGVFVAGTVLAKHDETYMPPEVAKALKEQGVWQEPKKAP